MGSFFAGFFAPTCIQKRYMKNDHSKKKCLYEKKIHFGHLFLKALNKPTYDFFCVGLKINST